MRLLYFDITQGNWIGARYIFEHFGWQKGGMILAKVKWREAFDNPFSAINDAEPPDRKQKLSQRQMAPLVILYEVLQEFGCTKAESLEHCGSLSKEVAVAFLNYNIPRLRKSAISGKEEREKKRILDRIIDRFFNAETNNSLDAKDNLEVDIHTCHFADYARRLGMPELGPLFCAADGFYFDNYQPEVDFKRTQTLAQDGKPCDFRFRWKEGQ